MLSHKLQKYILTISILSEIIDLKVNIGTSRPGKNKVDFWNVKRCFSENTQHNRQD